ncbi:MAG TPA: alcohol dehydrogenase catalytic domain-containing protein, partial [Stellaceae bacterium]|nr:alcohol dehydrogenase catalytic domain-containing protein [Stellaceae bacterium]
MRAAVFKAAGEPLAIEERPDPAPAPDEVVIRIGRCGICGSDLGMTERHARTVPRGSVLGHEYAGEVVALGKEATRLKLGDRVTALPVRSCGRCAACLAGLPLHCAGGHFAFGGFAELIAASEANCIALPADLSLADGALVEPLAVGLHGVDLARPPIGARILILGAGPIGLTVAFWLHRFGHRRVAICASSTRNEAL